MSPITQDSENFPGWGREIITISRILWYKYMVMTKKRPIIGIFFGNYHSDHSTRLISLFYDKLAGEDVDTIYYLGTESSSFLGSARMEESRYDYQYSYIFDYSFFESLDVLIIDFGSISVYQKTLLPEEFLKHLPGHIPVILVGQNLSVPGTVCIRTNSKDGMRMITKHLIKDHDVRRPAFVTGSLSSENSREYLDAFLEVCDHAGVDVPRSRIVIGDYSAHLDQDIENLLNREPSVDAIISSNDAMTIPIYRVLKKRGYIIGQDIAVTGIGNSRISRYMQPPLTTVDLNYPITVTAAVNQVRNLLHGRKTLEISIPVKLKIRSSCGMHMHQEAAEEVSGYDYTNELTKNEDGRQFGWFNALLLRELILGAKTLKDFFTRLGNALAQSGVKASYICLLESPQKVEPESGFCIDDHKLMLLMLQAGKEVRAWHRSEASVFLKDPVESQIQQESAMQFFTFLLFYQNYQYGTLSVCCRPDQITDFYGLSLELGTGLHFQILLIKQHRLLQDLEKKNQVLDFVASHDNLTGLYNRKELLSKTLEKIGQEKEERYAALMADLDHLKQINDNFGHGSGDYAIKTASEILVQALPPDALLGRIGGDEFLAFFHAPDGTEPEKVREKIHLLQDNLSRTSDRPFYVELSVGFTTFYGKEAKNIRSVIRHADRHLYGNKQKRRPSVIRPES